jgi:hypothetical protein
MNRREAAIALQGFDAAIAIIDQLKFSPRDGCHVAYMAQLPRIERVVLETRMKPLGISLKNTEIISKLSKLARQLHIFTTDEFLDAGWNSVLAGLAGLHVLLEGPSGSGLTTLAKFVSHFCVSETCESIPEIPRVLLGQESTVENFIGASKSQRLSSEWDDITNLIQRENGPLLTGALGGVPVSFTELMKQKHK